MIPESISVINVDGYMIYRESTSSEIEYAESIIKRLNNGSKEL